MVKRTYLCAWLNIMDTTLNFLPQRVCVCRLVGVNLKSNAKHLITIACKIIISLAVWHVTPYF